MKNTVSHKLKTAPTATNKTKSSAATLKERRQAVKNGLGKLQEITSAEELKMVRQLKLIMGLNPSATNPQRIKRAVEQLLAKWLREIEKFLYGKITEGQISKSLGVSGDLGKTISKFLSAYSWYAQVKKFNEFAFNY